MITIKSAREINLMKEAGKVIALVFKELKPLCKPGVTTLALSEKAEEIIRSHGCTPTFLGYGGFSGAICVSVNDTLIHGIPSNDIVLREGDIVSLDVGATYQGYCADAARTYPVGKVMEHAQRLMDVTRQSFFAGVKLIKENIALGDVCHEIQTYCEDRGYSLPRDYTGHGVGAHLHEDPAIPNYGSRGTGCILKAGMTLAIEPMVAEGRPKTRVMKDEWTVKMKDGKLSAHYENTVVVTTNGYEIITLGEDEERDE